MTEIERKWLIPGEKINRFVLKQMAASYGPLEQGYLNWERAKIHLYYKGFQCLGLFCGERRILREVPTDLSAFINLGGLKSYEVENELWPLILENPELKKGAEIRYRINEQGTSFLTVKSRGTLIRFEKEVLITGAAANILKSKVDGIVKKERFKIKDDPHMVEVDLYDDSMNFNFVSVEVEFKTKEAAATYQLPKFLGRYAKEVTENPVFKNENLALNPSLANTEFKRLFTPLKIMRHRNQNKPKDASRQK